MYLKLSPLDLVIVLWLAFRALTDVVLIVCKLWGKG